MISKSDIDSQQKPRHSWNWKSIPARYGTPGDLFIVVALLYPKIRNAQWIVSDLECGEQHLFEPYCIGAGKWSCDTNNLLTLLDRAVQVIDGSFVCTTSIGNTEHYILLEVVRNDCLDVQTSMGEIVEYFRSIFGKEITIFGLK